MRYTRIGLVMVAVLVSLAAISCSDDSAQDVYNGYLALLESRGDEVSDAIGEDIDIPDEIFDALGAGGFVGGTGDGSGSSAARGGTTVLGADGWLVGLVQGMVYLNGGDDEFYGTLGIGFRPGETLEVFLFIANGFTGDLSAEALYIDDLNAEDLAGNVFVGGGGYATDNEEAPIYSLDDCDFDGGAARGEGPYFGVWTQQLDYVLSFTFDPPIAGPSMFGLEIPESGLIGPVTVPGVYALDGCVL